MRHTYISTKPKSICTVHLYHLLSDNFTQHELLSDFYAPYTSCHSFFHPLLCSDHLDVPFDVINLSCECCRIRNLWTELINWLNIIVRTPVKADLESIILCNKNNDGIINHIIIVTKHEIYKSNWTKNSLNLMKIQKILKSQMDLDIYLGTIKDALQKYLGKWSGFYNVLRNM